ncbi:hypothetical protein FQN53_004645 [Emmonsiellopsis sp. PD_33]|nr:hypothetical protein FQN53_004645 [Emmonsiellopsis sp. PD_33]
MISMVSSSLGKAIAQAAPKDVKLVVRHLVTKLASCPPLFSPPPGQSDEPTSWESHFLTVSIDSDAREDGTDNKSAELFVFAVEVLVYITANLTTVFVSKADSTGYLYRLKLPPTAKSLVRSVSTAFLSHIISIRQRPSVRLVLSLFARAQNQYLFPGSVENSHKHILDDRGLVKWWCRVLDPILRHSEAETKVETDGKTDECTDRDTEATTASSTAYLIVPGCDKFESRTFFPPSAKLDRQDRPRWLNSYPLNQICASPSAPPRCLIPRFPDDPKARFLEELDGEIPETQDENNRGQWRSIKTIEQFWEMMAYRQECSSGRLVGFLWMVINPPGLLNSVSMTSATSQVAQNQNNFVKESKSPPKGSIERENGKSQVSDTKFAEPNASSNAEEPPTNEKMDTPAACLLPSSDAMASNTSPKLSQVTCQTDLSCAILLSNEDYQSLMNLLVQLDFDNEKDSITSTKSWISKLSTTIGKEDHGEIVIGQSTPSEASASQPTGTSNLLSGGLIRKRKKPSTDSGSASLSVDSATTAPTESNCEETLPNNEPQIPTQVVNVLNASMIRKKKKPDNS